MEHKKMLENKNLKTLFKMTYNKAKSAMHLYDLAKENREHGDTAKAGKMITFAKDEIKDLKMYQQEAETICKDTCKIPNEENPYYIHYQEMMEWYDWLSKEIEKF